MAFLSVFFASVLLRLYAADSLTVDFMKHVLCGHFHLVPLIILIWYVSL